MKYFIQKIYFYICKIYSYLLSKIDELFYRENIKECPHLKRNGYVKIKDKLSLDICKKLVQLVDHKKNKTWIISGIVWKAFSPKIFGFTGTCLQP